MVVQFAEMMEMVVQNVTRLTYLLMIVKHRVDHVITTWVIVKSALVKVTVKIVETDTQKYSVHVSIHPGDS